MFLLGCAFPYSRRPNFEQRFYLVALFTSSRKRQSWDGTGALPVTLAVPLWLCGPHPDPLPFCPSSLIGCWEAPMETTR